MTTILITGGCGAIGSVVLNTLMPLYPDYKFVNLDMLTYAGNPQNVIQSDNYEFIKGNICDVDMVSFVFNHYKPNIVLHFAAETHVDNSFGNSFLFSKTNILGTHVLLECARQYKENGGELKLFIHFSSDEVYGSNNLEQPFNENSLLLPSNPYSASKAAAEMICNAYIKSFKLPIIIVRCNNAVSLNQVPEKLVPKTIQHILNGEKVPVQGNGSSLRTYIDATDIAYALDIIMKCGEIGKIYNIGSDQEYSVLQVISIILNILKPGELLEDWIEFVRDRDFQDHRYWIDDSMLKQLGWFPTVSFKQAVQKVIDKYVKIS